jgi:transposase InsO family protein
VELPRSRQPEPHFPRLTTGSVQVSSKTGQLHSRGDAYDNAVAETFFATLKKELVNRRSWPSRLELQSAVFEYIEAFYNRQRRHSTLGMLSPVAYEQQRLSPLGS